MAYVAIVTVVALLQFIAFGLMVGRARARFGVHAPATTGHEVFERYHRVHANTGEQLIVFVPALWIFASFISPTWAAGFGVVYIVGRAIYASQYIKEPKSRSLGFALTAVPSLIMMFWILAWAINAIIKGTVQ